MNKRLYLQKLCNKYGDFYITNSYKDKDGNLKWFKHRKVSECWESEKDLWFLDKATHRSQTKNEIVLDFDEGDTFKNMNDTCDILESYQLKYKSYSTGSKGYHVHIFLKEELHPRIMKSIRVFLIENNDCDIMKIRQNSMIAIENIPHWKSGKIKTLVRCN